MSFFAGQVSAGARAGGLLKLKPTIFQGGIRFLMALHFLFIYPDFLEKTKHIRDIPGNYNEGIASISAALKEDGHRVSLYHETYMPSREEFLAKIREFSPDVIGFTMRTTVMDSATEMLAWLDKELPGIPVIAGGYHPTLAPGEVIDLPGVDAVCIGEGEFPTRDLIRDFAATGKFNTETQSFWFKLEDGTVVKNPVRPYLTDLDELPFPDLELFDYKNLKSNRINTAEVIISRGCLYSCTYCANAQLRNVYEDRKRYARFRSPENAIELLERVIAKDPGIQYLNFNDAILNMFPEWFYPFMKLYKERIHRKFTCNLRFDHMDEEMCRVMADCGCYLVTIGLENGNEEFRRKYLHRNMKNDHIVKVAKWLRDLGISVYTYNIVGLPHETLALTLETIKLNARIHVNNVVVSLFYPYPATKLRQIAEESGFISPDVALNDKVQLRMPAYPRGDILYARYSFHRLIKAYRKIYSIPDKEKAARKEAALDRRILGRMYPRTLIRFYGAVSHNAVIGVKRIASVAAPSIYKMLWRRKYKLKTS